MGSFTPEVCHWSWRRYMAVGSQAARAPALATGRWHRPHPNSWGYEATRSCVHDNGRGSVVVIRTAAQQQQLQLRVRVGSGSDSDLEHGASCTLLIVRSISSGLFTSVAELAWSVSSEGLPWAAAISSSREKQTVRILSFMVIGNRTETAHLTIHSSTFIHSAVNSVRITDYTFHQRASPPLSPFPLHSTVSRGGP